MDLENNKAQMRKGILEYCILSVLSRNSCYASDIIKELKEAEVIVVEGTLYPLLTRQKNYELTDEGRKYLADLDKSWQELVESVNQIRTR